MEVQEFEAIQSEFFKQIYQGMYCNVATVDRQNRPHSRVMHPNWDGLIGWVISLPQFHKAKQLVNNPMVSLAYIKFIIGGKQ